MTIDQYMQAMVSLLLEIRNNTRLAGTDEKFMEDLFPQAGFPPATPPSSGWPQGVYISDNGHTSEPTT